MNQSTRPSNYLPNQKQLYILKLTHKFRFITSPLLAEHRSLTTSSMNTALTNLHKQGYLGRHYDKSYKLAKSPATYYLANKGIRYLKDNTDLNDKSLHSSYKDKHLNQDFINTSLLVYRSFLRLRSEYQDHLFFTANDLRNFDHYPRPLPQLYFYKEDRECERQEYMLDIFTDNLFFYIKKRVDQYVAHYEEGDWKRSQYPTVILIVPDSRLKEKTEKYIEQARDGVFADETDLPFVVSTATIK